LKNSYLIAFLLCTTFTWSQSYTVTGDIIDEDSNPVAYANILLLKAQDSTVVTGTTSNDDGKFSFNDITANSYIIKTSFISYEDNYFTIVLDRNLIVPSIVLKESIEALSEVEVTYRKPTIKREVDRLVFNVEKTALSEGNMLEVLRSTPQVLVLDDAITVKGSTPAVYINDRKVHISSSEIIELLQGTSASNIKSVEVITNPPARYDAESGVVLSIIMSKNLVSGYNGSIFSNVTQGVFPKSNHGMTNYFKGEKINIFANYNFNNRKVNRLDRKTINYLNQEHWDTYVNRNTWSESHNFSLNFDWDLNENNTLSLSTNTQFLPYFKYVSKSETQITPIITNETARFNSQNLSKDKKQNLGFDFDFIHRFESKARLSVNAHYTSYDYKRNQGVDTDYFYDNDVFQSRNSFKTKSDQDAEIMTSQIDYVLPLGESSTFEMGAKLSNVKTGSAIVHNDIINGAAVLNASNTDEFDYVQDIYAGYMSYDKSWEKWSLSTGLRVEQSEIETFSASVNKKDNQKYLEWFPTINLGVQVSDAVNIYSNYKRSIQRPFYSDLNPFRFYLNDNTFVTGNPELQPIFTDHVKVGFSIGNVFTIESYYKKYKNNIFELPFQDNINNTLAYTSVNINFTEEFGFDFEAYFDVVKNWTVYFGTSFYNIKDNATLFNSTVKRDKWSNYSILTNDFSFLKNKSLTVSFAMSYIHENIQGLQLVDTRLDSNLSIRKTILKGKGSLSLIISDLFNEQDYFWATKFANQDNTEYVDLDNRYIKLGFRYNFGNTKLSTNERTSSVDERDRLGTKH